MTAGTDDHLVLEGKDGMLTSEGAPDGQRRRLGLVARASSLRDLGRMLRNVPPVEA